MELLVGRGVSQESGAEGDLEKKVCLVLCLKDSGRKASEDKWENRPHF